MTKRYVQCGIDHGTTNSCIAIMDGDKPRVIKPNPMHDVMPSAVYYDKRGRRFVGQSAVEAMWGRGEEGNGHTGYKLSMGQDDRFEFSAARKVMTAPELGAIVIGELLRFYREETGDDPKACVISVPAKFDQSACDGTGKAAKLAGLLYYPLPQEPVVAALAYGLTQKDEHAQWMVFDLGGGTLDVSLVLVRNGEMVVPQNGHMGDTYLGGRRFDREVLAYALSQLSQDYDLKDFKEKSPKYGPAFGTLMLAAETAKIELSEKDSSVIQVNNVLCEDERGKPVKVSVPITRSQYEKLVARDVERAVHYCQLLLSRNRLSSRSVDRLILVGGPTKTPYIQQVLQDHLKIPFDTSSIDPMTAVAQGAAIHGTTVEIPREITWSSGVDKPLSEVELQLEYEAKSSLPTYCVAGKVNGPAVVEDGVSVEISRADGLWSSGQIPVDESGFFNAEVSLIAQETPTRSRFTTRVFNQAGELLSSVEEPEIWYPFPVVRVRLASSLLVAVKGNLTEKLIEHGSELPAHRTESFLTTKSVRKGNSDDVLRVTVLEAVTNLFGAEDSHADCNFHVGTLVIAGSDERVTQDIPLGSDIEVTLHEDESRTIRAQAYLPLLDEQFEGEFYRESFDFDLDEITERFETLKRSLSGSENLQLDYPISEVEQALADVRRLAIVESISKDLERAHAGEQNARNSAYKAILAFAGSLNHIHRLQVDAHVRHLIENLEPVLHDAEAKELAEIKSQYESLSKSNTEQLLGLESRLLELDFQVRQRPLFDLTLDWGSFPPTFYGNAEQLESFRDAERLVLEITEQRRNGGEVSQAQFDQCARAHDRLLKAWPELLDWRSKKWKEVVDQGRGFDIEKAGRK